MDSQLPFADILLGQPQLRRRCGSAASPRSIRRIALRYELPGMEAPESAAYLTHHLKHAGREDRLFSDLHQADDAATQALVACYAAQKSVVDESSAHAAIRSCSAPLCQRHVRRS